MESIGMNVELSIRLEIKNKVSTDMVLNFSVGERIKYMEIQIFLMRKL